MRDVYVVRHMKSKHFKNFFKKMNGWMNGRASRKEKARKEKLAGESKGVTKSMTSSHKRANYALK